MKRGFLILILFIGAVLGFYFGSKYQIGVIANKAPYKELEKFSKVLQFVEANYVEEVKTEDLLNGAIRGMLQGLDPHSSYLNQEVFREMKEETSGKFGGLGIEVTLKDGIITVVTPIDDTPAFKAGIKAGDQVIKIGDQSTKNVTLPEAVNFMRGKPGSKVKITIYRKETGKVLEYNLARESIRVQSVKSTRLDKDVGYFRVSSFIERTAEDISKQMSRLNSEQALGGIILDLRGNPGGLLDQAIKVVNLFVDQGPIVYTIGRDRNKKEIEEAHKGRKTTDLPLVVLVDGSSASASEIVSGALQDYGRAIIAGQRTFGKGSVQTVIPLGDDSGLKLTVSRYYTPSGRSIQVRGIMPDVILDYIDPKVLAEAQSSAAKKLREGDLEGHFSNEENDEVAPIKPIPVAVTTPDPENESFEVRVKKDYMVQQAQGILKTIQVIHKGSQKPEFKIQEEPLPILAKLKLPTKEKEEPKKEEKVPEPNLPQKEK